MMRYKQKLIDFLCTFSKVMISLSELEQAFQGEQIDYETFAGIVMELENEGSLEAVKSHGRNGKPLSLAYHYRINKRLLQGEYVRELHQWSTRLHPDISLDAYYRLSPDIWRADLPYIEQIDAYLKRGSRPTRQAPAPERSYELVQDEKWITDHGGQALLERLGIWEQLQIVPVSDPLMLAVNPSIGFTSKNHLHLIVENKSTFQGLVPELPGMAFSSLILGYGRKIVGNLGMLSLQYPVQSADHELYYFGDIDLEGIMIWYDLHVKFGVKLALPFYLACLDKPSARGKQNHRLNEEALHAFISFFNQEEANRINAMLGEGCYIPQETLKSEELIRVGRETVWSQKGYQSN
ncbi:DUF2220 domain-containing protein [Paenibacillus sp. alder61]|uniref:Wadjet anti-phage system protein JetD domain-containing protein n=1 Tax=Paenibacillus sp. alder61 TaxID=2862948 RepID=UPI001CD724D9|nr:Wadjet anti-phage system protein JetD domain-containing protein [Paenibacillus sp. alder61]MCA1292776.1 DUF2220 domain-containing protein [Paenibacillus sp. alder61]